MLPMTVKEETSMFKIIDAGQAAEMIKDGDCVCVNAFLALSNAEEIHKAIYERFIKTGSPKNLTLVSQSGYGFWDENRLGEPYIRAGAAKKLIFGHYGCMPGTGRLVLQNELEAYNLPMGAISHAIRAQAAGLAGYISKVGLGIFVDPRVEGPGVNSISNDNGMVRQRRLTMMNTFTISCRNLTLRLLKAQPLIRTAISRLKTNA